MRRTLAATTLLVVATTALPGRGAAAQDADRPVPDIRVEPFTLEVVDGPDDEFAVTLDADRYVPATATAGDPAPVVLLAHGFGGDKTGYADLARTFAAEGYVVVSYSARGFGASTREIGLDGIDFDVKDVQQLVDEIATWPQVLLDAPGDPRIGMHGDSYGGGITLQVAAVDDRLDAIVPRITWSALSYALAPNNLGATLDSPYDQPFGIFKQAWTTVFFGLGTAQPVVSNEGFALDTQSSECVGFVSGLCQTYARISATGRGDAEATALLQDSSPDVRYDGITAPTFLIQGQDDTLFNLRDSVRNLTAVRANGVDTKLLWFNGGHSGPDAPGERVEQPFPDDVMNSRIIAWWDRWLREDPSVDTGPGLEWYRDWVDTTAATIEDAYDSAPAYPAVEEPTELLLSGDGGIVTDPGDVVAGELTFGNPPLGQPAAFSEDPLRLAPFEPTEVPGQHVAFTSEPFEVDTEVVGIPELELALASLTGEAHLHVRIYDVAPDGTELLVRRLTSPVYAEDLTQRLTVSHPGFVHRFDEGHAVRVVLASTDVSYANRQLPDVYTVAIDATDPPVLRLPVLGAGGVAGADGPPGPPAGTPAPDPAPATDPAPPTDPGPRPGPRAAAPGSVQQLPATGGGTALLAVGLLAAAALGRRRA